MGGSRVGSGRKPAQRGPLGDVVDVTMPDGLGDVEQSYWLRLAPHATLARTLTAATVDDFTELVHLLAERDACLIARRDAGWTDAGTKLSKEYRGLVQRCEGKLRAYMLAAAGKPMPTAEAEVDDPFLEFDYSPEQWRRMHPELHDDAAEE